MAEKCLSDASAVLEKRMVSHPTEKEELASIVNDIKRRIVEHKEMEKGVFSDTYVKAPGCFFTLNLLSSLSMFRWQDHVWTWSCRSS